jgi:hypothetical protein
MVRKLGGDDDAFISYRTSQYKLHYYETPSNLRFALLTEVGAPGMRNVLHQIYINLWVEYGESLPTFFSRGAIEGRRRGGRDAMRVLVKTVNAEGSDLWDRTNMCAE